MANMSNQYHTTYKASVKQKDEILGIGIALQAIASSGHDSYDESHLNQIIGRMDALTYELGFRIEDRYFTLNDFMIRSNGRYSYYRSEPLVSHVPEITIAYRRLANLVLQE